MCAYVQAAGWGIQRGRSCWSDVSCPAGVLGTEESPWQEQQELLTAKPPLQHLEMELSFLIFESKSWR